MPNSALPADVSCACRVLEIGCRSESPLKRDGVQGEGGI